MARVVKSLAIDGNTLPTTFIRYNPHCHSTDGVKQRILQDERHDKLLETIYSTKFDAPFSVCYLFYDTINAVPCILNDCDYTESFKQFVLLT